MNRIYIGSNNDTKILEIDKIELIINQYHDGYTIIKAVGYWKGSKEDTAIVEIMDSIDFDMIEELKKELKQESILLITKDGISIMM